MLPSEVKLASDCTLGDVCDSATSRITQVENSYIVICCIGWCKAESIVCAFTELTIPQTVAHFLQFGDNNAINSEFNDSHRGLTNGHQFQGRH
jgi:hypothetical protein